MTNSYTFAQDLSSFIAQSPTAFHASSSMKNTLLENGYSELDEKMAWQLKQGQGYLVERNGSIISFVLGTEENVTDGFRMIGAHTDSPCLQIKPHAKSSNKHFFKVAIEIYGGPLLNTWFDRELSIAGRVFTNLSSGEYKELLIDFKSALLLIPSLAIHFDREANTKRSVDKQKDLYPVIGDLVNKQLPDFNHLLTAQIEKEHGELQVEEILSYDLFCYDIQAPNFFGINQAFLTGPRIDNLLSCYCGMRAQLGCDLTKNNLLMCFNHEENGSTSMSGGNGNFLQAILSRLAQGESYHRCLASSYLISADNAHATHPNSGEKSDPDHHIAMNLGPVIKINANQRYASNAPSIAAFKALCIASETPYQEFVMKNDMPCGSTIGPMVSANFGITTVDVGVASLAMHSVRETTGTKDPYLLYTVLHQFYTSSIYKEFI